MKIRTDFVTNSSSQSYIAVAIDNPELARLCSDYIRKLGVIGDKVYFRKDYYEGIDERKIQPRGGSFVDWFLNFLNEIDPQNSKASEQINDNRQAIEDSLIESTIVVDHIDEAEGFYWEERRNKDTIELKGFDDLSWDNVWDSVSHKDIGKLYQGDDVERLSPSRYPFRQLLSDNWQLESSNSLDETFFRKMMDQYGKSRDEQDIEEKSPKTIIADGFVIYGGCLFEYKGEDEEIVIPNDVTTITADAFEDCYDLRSITIPSSVTHIGFQALMECPSLEKVVFNDWESFLNLDVELEVDGPFWGDADIYINGEELDNRVIIPEGVTRIGRSVFHGSNVSNVSLPESLEEIGDLAFFSCVDLTEIIIPNSVTRIGYLAFEDCNGLTSITIPDSVVSICSLAFENCEDLECAYFSDMDSFFSITIRDYDSAPANLGWRNVDYYINGELVKDIVIPAGVTDITGLFSGCKSIESITIPASVTTMAEESLYNCDSLKSLCFSDLDSFLNIDRMSGVYGSAGYVVDYYVDGELLTELSIPEGMTKIGECAFSGCGSLESITIPTSVTSIGEEAFNRCCSLSSIKIPNSVTSIGSEAFFSCKGLTSITIPNSVKSIGRGVFRGDDDLTIYASSGSYAEEYAKKNNIPFEAID